MKKNRDNKQTYGQPKGKINQDGWAHNPNSKQHVMGLITNMGMYWRFEACTQKWVPSLVPGLRLPDHCRCGGRGLLEML